MYCDVISTVSQVSDGRLVFLGVHVKIHDEEDVATLFILKYDSLAFFTLSTLLFFFL